VPQGSSSSMLLAFIYLTRFAGRSQARRCAHGAIRRRRNPDVEYSKDLKRAERVLERVAAQLKLHVHDSGTKSWRGNVDAGVNYLGFVIRPESLEVAQIGCGATATDSPAQCAEHPP